MEFDPDKFLNDDDDFDPDAFLQDEPGTQPVTKAKQNEYGGEMGARAWQSVLEPVAEASSFVDRYVGAPFRAGLQETQKEREEYNARGETNPVFSFRPLQAAWQQFGEDPSKAPTYGQIAEGYGASPEKDIPFPTVENFATPGARFKQQNISQADLLGGGIGAVADPISYIPGPNIVGRAGKAASTAAKTPLKVQGKAIDSFAKTGVGIPEDAWNYYKKHSDRLSGKVYNPAEIETIRAKMIDEADKIRFDHEELIKQSKSVKQTIKDEIKKLETEMSLGSVPDIEEVRVFQDALEYDKKIQGELSAQADEALGELNIKFRRKDLENMIRAGMKDILPVADGAKARAQLEKLLTETNEAYAPLISGRQLREYMQAISKIPNYDLPPGAYNSELDKFVKAMRFKISDFLKKQGSDGSNPTRYEKIMNEMSNRLRASQELAEYFQSDTRGLATLKKLMGSGDQATINNLDRIMREYVAVSQHQGLAQYVDDMATLREQKKLLDLDDRESVLAPGLTSQAQDIDATIEMNKPLVESISKINRPSTEPLIKNIGQAHGGNYYNREQLKSLEEMSGIPFEEQIRDAGVLKEFTKDRTRGSKRTTPGSITGALGAGSIGTITGDPTTGILAAAAGSYLGNKAGQYLDVQGGNLAKRLFDRNLARQQAVEKFYQKMQNPSGNFKKYADAINRMGERGQAPVRSLVLYHQILWNNDPEYRKALEE